jgi:multiple sugar transport system permease protein
VLPLKRADLKKAFQQAKKNKLGYVLLLPSGAIVALLILFPIVLTLSLSLEQASLGAGIVTKFIGLQNFVTLFRDPLFFKVLGNSVLYSATFVSLEILTALGIALLLNQKARGTRWASTLILSAWVTPYVAAAYVWEWILNNPYGVFNAILVQLGIITKSITWLGLPSTAMGAVLLATLWKLIPFLSIVFYAGLQGVRNELYEVAILDGAGVVSRFRYVTLPALRYLLLLMVFLVTVWSFGQWDLIFLMTKGGPIYSTTTLSFWSYSQAFENLNIGYGSAISTFLFLILSVFAIIYIRRVRGN